MPFLFVLICANGRQRLPSFHCTASVTPRLGTSPPAACRAGRRPGRCGGAAGLQRDLAVDQHLQRRSRTRERIVGVHAIADRDRPRAPLARRSTAWPAPSVVTSEATAGRHRSWSRSRAWAPRRPCRCWCRSARPGPSTACRCRAWSGPPWTCSNFRVALSPGQATPAGSPATRPMNVWVAVVLFDTPGSTGAAGAWPEAGGLVPSLPSSPSLPSLPSRPRGPAWG